ncbi:hypothetical protein C1H46_011645 [Malus baccata]|uniref:Uncharacterized protein n=1 Tax=Malus baccata TaxID=106549 RepID=A0A540MVC8_MALBA|nr:hypothetical protein C1H46_011645 [Malus baccata]
MPNILRSLSEEVKKGLWLIMVSPWSPQQNNGLPLDIITFGDVPTFRLIMAIDMLHWLHNV